MKVMRLGSGFLIMGLVCLTGCQTTSKSPDTSSEIPNEVSMPHDFIPANFISRVKYEKGQYKNLFSPTTHALWVDKNISDVKLAYEQQQVADGEVDVDLIGDAAWIAQHYMIIECHIESTSPDASIAYDLSSLRNLTMYLQTSNGTHIYPLQHVIASPAEKEQQGTLKQFKRTNLLVFAKEDIISGAPTVPADVNQLRLYIEGFNTSFYFEWVAQEPIVIDNEEQAEPKDITDVIRWRPNQTETYQVLKVRFSDLYTNLQALTRMPEKSK